MEVDGILVPVVSTFNNRWYGEFERYGEPYFELYMDLNYTIGERAPGLGEIIADYCKDFDGVTRRVICGTRYDSFGILGARESWIEGIGSNTVANQFTNYLFRQTPSQSYYHQDYYLALCTQDGVPIYDIRDKLDEMGIYYGETSSVNTIPSERIAENVEDDNYYNLQGLKTTNPKSGEIYIHHGKKIKYSPNF